MAATADTSLDTITGDADISAADVRAAARSLAGPAAAGTRRTCRPTRVLGLETNRRFVEAYMVGLNVEMGRELLWRGFPTNQLGTYFDHFWGGGADIKPLHTWGDRPLGRCAQLGAAREFRHAAAQRAAAPLSQCADLSCARRQRPGDRQARPERGRGQREAAGLRRRRAARHQLLRLRRHGRPGRRLRHRSRLLRRDPAASDRAAFRPRRRRVGGQREPSLDRGRQAGAGAAAAKADVGLQRRAHGRHHAPPPGAPGDPRLATSNRL